MMTIRELEALAHSCFRGVGFIPKPELDARELTAYVVS
jgi:hypothetical protein